MPTPIETVLTSRTAAKALRAEGWDTIEDLNDVPAETLHRIRGVGDVSLEELAAARSPSAPTATPVEESWEESDAPIHLDSPYRNFALRITNAGEVRNGRRVRVINPVFLRFESGRARLTRDLYLLAKYDGDKVRAREARNANEPWRLEALKWLRAKPAFRANSFIILTD